VNNSPIHIDKPVGQAYWGGGVMRCNAGDIMVGWRVWSGAWLDGLAPRCAPFTKFTITYNVNSGGGTAPATQQQSGPNASINLSSTYTGTRTGFTLSGWNTQANGLGTNYAAGATITPTVNLVLYAKWLSTITYNGNSNTGGTVPDPTVAVSSAAITTLAQNSGNLANTGFTFTGWNTAANGSGTNYAAGLTTYASTGDITLYAQWNSTITYDGNGQTSASSTVPASTIAKGTAANTTLANAGTMLKTGYTFAGWNTQADGLGTPHASGLTTYQATGSRTLYAKWTRTITYNSNGATTGSPERATDVFVNSTTPSISTFPTVGTMVKTGYTFAGWSTTTSGTALSTPYSTTGEVPLYARWTANTYTIVYDTSTVTSGTMAMADTSFTAGTSFSLRANAFAPPVYSFNN
jgi:uncharacterized repeat protein (TIGR02543 family)